MARVTTSDLKQANMENILARIYDRKITSNPALAADLGLSRPTVTQCVNMLEAAALVEKEGFVESTRGRKATAVHFVSAARIAIGAELLRDHYEIVAIDLYGTILRSERCERTFRHDPEYYDAVSLSIHRFIQNLKAGKKRVLGVGIVLQGLISADGTKVTYGKILGCTGLTVDAFTKHLPYPCRLFHDAESAARVELWEDRQLLNAIFFNIRTNLSGALIVGGHFLPGNELKSGVFEHMTLVPDGKPCYCGKKGCVDVYCSYPVLLCPGETLEDFFGQLRQGNPKHQEKWESYLKDLAAAIDDLHMVIDYDVILGGTLGRWLWPEDLAALHRYVLERTAFPSEKSFIRTSRQQYVPPAKGAALQFVTQFLASVMGGAFRQQPKS